VKKGTERSSSTTSVNQDLAFSTTQNPFASLEASHSMNDGLFGFFDDIGDHIAATDEIAQAFSATSADCDVRGRSDGTSRGSNQYHHQRTMGGNEEPAKPLKSRSRSSTCATKSYYQGRRNSRRSY
jgi:hypothetical protein